METEANLDGLKRLFNIPQTSRRTRRNLPVYRAKKKIRKEYVVLCKTFLQAYRQMYLNYTFRYLEIHKDAILISKPLIIFFSKQLKNERSKDQIRSIHALHSLTLNPCSVAISRLAPIFYIQFFNHLFNNKHPYNFLSFSFLTKEILADILKELCVKFSKNKKYELILSPVPYLHYDERRSPFVYFNVLAVYLVVGIEALLKAKLYNPLKSFFNHMLINMSRNKLSSHSLLKIWDKLLLLCKNWIQFALCHPPKSDLKSSNHAVEFQTDQYLSIFSSACIRDKLKYEFIHIKDNYVPCEYPLVPSFPKQFQSCFYPSDRDTFWSLTEYVANWEKLDVHYIGVGSCKDCKQSNCSCAEDYLEAEAEKQHQSASDIDKVDNATSDGLVPGSSCPGKSKPLFASSDIKLTFEELSKHYDSLPKHTISYSFSDSQPKLNKNIRMPDLTDAFYSTSRNYLRVRHTKAIHRQTFKIRKIYK